MNNRLPIMFGAVAASAALALPAAASQHHQGQHAGQHSNQQRGQQQGQHAGHRQGHANHMDCQTVSSQAVEAQFRRFNDAWATGNPDRVASLFSRNAVLLATVSNQPRTDRAGIRDYFVTFLRNRPVGAINTSTVRLGCNAASRVGTWTVRLTDPTTGQSQDVRARYSFIYVYEDGDWKIDHLHSSMMPEPAGRTG